ncbi:MAG TPA: nucleotidyltransferase family protein [Thermomicrobiales bacterium]|nr:nucleotidyltransferase family protein [Thermomicrobiales bacterium]
MDRGEPLSPPAPRDDAIPAAPRAAAPGRPSGRAPCPSGLPGTVAREAGVAPGLRLGPEEEALLLAVRAVLGPAERARLSRLLGEGRADWRRLWRLAVEQQVLPLVARTLTDLAATVPLPASIVQAARGTRLQTTLANLPLHHELVRIGELFAARGLPVTPLKGTHLAERLYGGLDARWCGDIDILVPEDARPAARAALGAAGYAPSPSPSPGELRHTFHDIPFVRRQAGRTFVVELHTRLSNPRFVSIAYPALWRRILGDDAPPGLRPLPAEELLVFLALHLAKHDLGKLRLLADVDRLVRREAALDWPGVLALAANWRAAHLTYFALAHARLLFGTPAPPAALRALAPPAWRRRLVGALAGPRAILSPPSSPFWHYRRSRLAYGAMLGQGQCPYLAAALAGRWP